MLDRRYLGFWVLVAMVACSDDGLSPATGGTAADEGGTLSPTSAADDDGGGDGATAATADSQASGSGGSGGNDDGGDDGATGLGDTANDGTAGESMMCASDEECTVINSCCECSAQHVDDPVLPCKQECFAPLCDANAINPVAACVEGQCMLAGLECNGALVVCDEAPPECRDGTLPSILNGCWTGDCVPIQLCGSVADCTVCPDELACVAHVFQAGPIFACVAIPERCAGEPTCACMGELACESDFRVCEEEGFMDADLGCSCPTC